MIAIVEFNIESRSLNRLSTLTPGVSVILVISLSGWLGARIPMAALSGDGSVVVRTGNWQLTEMEGLPKRFRSVNHFVLALLDAQSAIAFVRGPGGILFSRNGS